MVNKIINNYEKFYFKENKILYPAEFVVRIFLSKNNRKFFSWKPKDKILDLSFGDGRNLFFFKDINLDVYGTEISKKIINNLIVKRKISAFFRKKLKVGFASRLPFKKNFFDLIIAYNSCYYLLPNKKFEDNLHEIFKILKKNGYFICTIPTLKTYYFRQKKTIKKNVYQILNDPLNLRNNNHLYGIKSIKETQKLIKKKFKIIKKGYYTHNFSNLRESGYYFILKK